jgi:hypothetical protein
MNPNTISAGIQEVWDATYQVTHHKVPVYPAISNFRLQPGLQKGDTVHREYRDPLVANDMAGDGGYERQAIVDTDETLTISYEKEASFYIKKLDEIQNHLPVAMKHAYDASVAIFNQIDADVLGQYDQFTRTLDAGDLGGTNNEGITVVSGNVTKLFSNSTRLLQRANIMIDNTAAFTGFKKEDSQKNMAVSVISPDVYATIIERLDGKDSALGDKVGIEGHAGRYMGYELFVSNATGWSGELFMATNPTANDTVTVNGVTFTFVATPAAAGQVDIGASADATRVLLAQAINNTLGYAAGAGTAASYFEVTAANRKLLKGIVAIDTPATDILSIKAVGKGFVVVSETFTAAADIWTPAKQVQHCLFGVANAIDVVVQQTPNMLIKDRDGKVGKDVVTWAAYGIKVFNEGKPKMVDVWVRTDTYSA